MRYIIGIDLGTTNCALAFVDTEQPSLPLQLFAVQQLTSSGKVDALLTLPSFCYLVSPGEWPSGALKLPWKEESTTFVGQFAKIQGAQVPTRLVQSAKSWLCNIAANRRDKILPIEAADFSLRLSPIEASAKYLIHLRDAWNSAMAKGNPSLEMEEQEIILTVPASFDEAARTLTVEAARQAGFLHVTLVEEPQAAFYSWISQHEQDWKNRFKAGDSILVCDVGGGTTDFSLIEIQQQDGDLAFQRMAVGDHLLLGGDNIDAALTHYLEQKLQNEGKPPLESSQWLQLKAEARAAKEVLLGLEVDQDETYSIVLQGTGSFVVKGSLAVTITRQEIENLLLKGFFGLYPLPEALQLIHSRGFRTMGLPYEDEPSMTKHLAHFLQQAHYFDSGKGIDYILFNGGTLKPEIFKEAFEQSLISWFPHKPLQRLSSVSLDLAVAKGAAYYGKARRGFGVAIGGGTPRTYYLKIDVKNASGQITSKALTLLPRGSQEGREFHPTQIFALRPNVPVSFHLMTSHVRLKDQEGDLLEIDPMEMQALPPIQTILRYGRKAQQEETIPVRLGIRLTPIGTVELWLESQRSEHQWTLEFQLRSATGQDSLPPLSRQEVRPDETFEKGYLEEAKESIETLYQPESLLKPGQIIERLEAEIGTSRRDWGPSLLRELWEPLLKMAPRRNLSAEHEARWWNLAGFFLRPGFGFSLDDFRIKELWKMILANLNTPKTPECQIQMWICFRRVAGGFNKGQQMQLASELVEGVLDKKIGKIDGKRKSNLYIYSEKIRALASFERLDLPLKIRLGNALVDRLLHQTPANYDYWALGRLGARHLVYGSAGQVVPKDVCTKWIEKLLAHQPSAENQESMIFLLRQLARKTDHRELNLSEAIIQKILAAHPHDHLKQWLLEEHTLTEKEQEQVFGDQLPAGLVLELHASEE
jgi:molecular chaperone DnaK (HSP70)